MLLLQEAQVQSLVEILGFYMPCGAAKKKKSGGKQRNQMNKKITKNPRSVVAKSEGAG